MLHLAVRGEQPPHAHKSAASIHGGSVGRLNLNNLFSIAYIQYTKIGNTDWYRNSIYVARASRERANLGTPATPLCDSDFVCSPQYEAMRLGQQNRWQII